MSNHIINEEVIAHNPFIHSKREFEPDMPIYVTTSEENGFFEWISGQNIIFEGIRGSGKSSILKALEWSTAWGSTNTLIESTASITEYFNEFPPKHFGVKLRVEDLDVKYWDGWKQENGELEAQKYFGTYLEYTIIAIFLNALYEISRKHQEYFNNWNAEKSLISKLMNEAFPDPRLKPPLSELSIPVLHKLLLGKANEIRDLIFRRIDKAVISSYYSVIPPGSLIQHFAQIVRHEFPIMSEVIFMPLIDDCNHLSMWQTKVLNSAILKAQHPVSYKITSVWKLYKTRDTVDKRPITEHELKTFHISGNDPSKWDYKAIPKFLEIVNGVCKSRIGKIYEKKYAEQFNLEKILGSFNLDELLYKNIMRSESLDAINFSKLLEEKRSKSPKLSVLSVWKNNFVNKNEINSEVSDDYTKRLKRRENSSFSRKYNYTWAFQLCDELNIKFPHAGYETILHLSYSSIREVLRIMCEIWQEAKLPIEQFVQKKELNYTVQSQAIYNTSKSFFNTITDNTPLFDCEETNSASICDRLGKLFKLLQSEPYSSIAPETASLAFEINEENDSLVKVLDVIDYLVINCILLKSKNGNRIMIGLHPLLSPLYKISFRYPFYYPETVISGDIVMLFTGNHQTANTARDNILSNRLKKSKKKLTKKCNPEICGTYEQPTLNLRE